MKNDFVLAISQLGYLPGSSKTATLVCTGDSTGLPDRIPFYIQSAGSRLKRKQSLPPGWKGRFFRWPYQLGDAEPEGTEKNFLSVDSSPLHKAFLIKKETRWGTVWQGDFTDFHTEGIFQLETAMQASVPFAIDRDIYRRAIRSYMVYINAQRSGMEIPGVRRAEHLDDAVLDTDGTQIEAVGGWYDAGDFRKWMTLTQGNLEGLYHVAKCGISHFEELALDEIRWGNRFYHAMIDANGLVYEDVGGGTFKDGLDIEKDWWFENHPGCNCNNAGNVITDNQQGTGDERIVRTKYNPLVQFQFACYQAKVATLFEGEYREKCNALAWRAWDYCVSTGHDNRTLFLAAQVMAAVELHRVDPGKVDEARVMDLVSQLLGRQFRSEEGISGFFTEKDGVEGFRSVAFSTFPVQALLAAYTLLQGQPEAGEIAEALERYVHDYLEADARSNPYHVLPYGVYGNPVFPEYQVYRDAGNGKYIRSFMHPINPQEIIHGTNSTLMAHASFLVSAAELLDQPDWKILAERQVQWAMGHNPTGLSLFTGIGYRHPVLFSGVQVQVPEATCAGFIGTPGDIPYLETSNWIEWSTQEMWDVPIYELAIAATFMI